MSLVSTFSGFLPSFMTEKQYESQKDHILDILGRNDREMTAREIHDKTPYFVSSVRARLDELHEDGEIYKFEDQRECSVADHDQKVNVYGKIPYRGV